MKNFLSSTGHSVLALATSLLGYGIAATQTGAIGGKVGLGILGAGIIYQAFTGKALSIPTAPAIPTPAVAQAPAVAPAPAPQPNTPAA